MRTLPAWSWSGVWANGALLGVLLTAACSRGGAAATPTAAVPTRSPASEATQAPPSPTPTPAGVEYTVKEGDTLSRIAAQNGSSVDAIVKANGLGDPDKIQVGQKLIIPGGSASAAPGPTSSSASGSGSAAGATPVPNRPPPP